MSVELRGPAFRAAFNEAQQELEEITQRFELLLRRKALLETAIAALEPMMSLRAVQTSARESVRQSSPAVAEPTPTPAPAAVVEMPTNDRKRDVAADPLQRQINQALGLAALA
jgi:hypothetical protein